MNDAVEPVRSSSPGPNPRSFSVWLKAMAEFAGVAEPSALHSFLMEHGCQCTKESVAAWLAGKEPTFEKSRDIIKAFHLGFPDREVWAEYKRFVRGEPFMQAPAGSGDKETLEQILHQTGLPPGLAD